MKQFSKSTIAAMTDKQVAQNMERHGMKVLRGTARRANRDLYRNRAAEAGVSISVYLRRQTLKGIAGVQ